MENPSIPASASLAGKPDDTIPGSAQVARGLSRLLVSTQILCRQSLYCHWQVTESDLHALHSLFEHHYQSLRKASDTIADRVRTLGYTPPEHPAWGTKASDALPPEEMLREHSQGHQACAREAKKVVSLADAAGDNFSSHIAGQRFAVHDRAARLLLALLQAREPLRSAV